VLLSTAFQVTDTYDIVLAGMKMSRFCLEMRTKFEVPVCSLYNSVFRTIITVAGRSIRMWSAVDGSIVKEFKLISSSVRQWMHGLVPGLFMLVIVLRFCVLSMIHLAVVRTLPLPALTTVSGKSLWVRSPAPSRCSIV
jgi:hypothetical protein